MHFFADPPQACMQRAAPSFLPHDTSTLPLLAVVVTTSDAAADRAALHNLETYCHRHGYYFHASLINTTDWLRVPSSQRQAVSFFTARWLHLQRRLLGKYQWILALDGDTLAVGLDNDLSSFLGGRNDVVLHLRENYELPTGVVLLRSSPFTWCFLENIIRAGTIELSRMSNYDNGDMMDVFMTMVDPAAAAQCRRHRAPGQWRRFVACFKHNFLHRLDGLGTASPFRVLFPFAGFWRSMEGLRVADAADVKARVFYACAHAHDVLVHGWKRVGTIWAAERDSHDVADSVSRPAACAAIPESATLDLAKRCCHWRYAGCSVGGGNVCSAQKQCAGRRLEWAPECAWEVGDL